MIFFPRLSLNFHRRFVTAFVLLLFAAWLPAQTGDSQSLEEKLCALEARIEQLEQRARQPPAETPPPVAPQEIAALRRQLDVLAAEVERLRSGEPAPELPRESAQSFGLGPAAASVYQKKQGVSIAGYGELLFEDFSDRSESGASVDRTSQLDALRAVFYAGYRFNDKFVFNSEIEFEHAAEPSVEFAYIDYLATPSLTFRGGLLLVPMGLVNEFHEPTVFLGARRPETETRLIPSTWRENGVGLLASKGGLNGRLYLVNGLNAAGFRGDGLRSGRQKGARAKAADFGLVGRLDWTPAPGLLLGGSFYSGESDQDELQFANRQLEVDTFIGELHAQIQLRGFDLRALYAQASLDDAAGLNAVNHLTGATRVAERLRGGYVQAGYNLLAPVTDTISLAPFYRYEVLNTHHRMPSDSLPDPSHDRTFHTLGLQFKPVYGIVVKSDYQWIRNQARTGVNQLNVGLGYAF